MRIPRFTIKSVLIPAETALSLILTSFRGTGLHHQTGDAKCAAEAVRMRPRSNLTANLRQCGECSGFTLLEVLVALALLSIALIVILQLFSANLRGITASEETAKAMMKADSAMREVLDDEDIDVKSSSETTNDGYRIDVSITNAADDRTSNLSMKLLEINLTVHWRDGARERAVTLKTMKAIPRKV